MRALLYRDRRVRDITTHHKITLPSQSHDRQPWLVYKWDVVS